jgi:hypothetical protein
MIGCFSLALACGGESASSGSEDGGSTTGEEPEAAPCERVLDPAIYPEHLIWSPPLAVADSSCPASGPSFVIDLPTPILVTGTVTLDGNAGDGRVKLIGRGDEGEVSIGVQGGSFSAEVLPGRYDVTFRPTDSAADLIASWTVYEDIEILAPLALAIDTPVVTVSGAMTMDGLPAPDPYGWLRLPGGNPGVLLRMIDGLYAFTATPGTYNVNYVFCDPTVPPAPDLATGDCYDPDHPPQTEPKLGPDQFVRVMTLEVGSDDLEIDLDVPTAIVSGTVSLDGGPPDPSASLLFGDGLLSNIDVVDGSFATRWVATDYEHAWLADRSVPDAWLGPHVEERPDLQHIEADLNVDILRSSASILAPWPGQGPFTGMPRLLMWSPGFTENLDLRAKLETDVAWPQAEVAIEGKLWPDVRSVAIIGNMCWPDFVSPDPLLQPQRLAVMLGDAVELSGVVELDTAIEGKFATVHVDLLWDAPGGFLAIKPIARPPETLHESRHAFFLVGGSELDIHGYLPQGPAAVELDGVTLGIVYIEDGTTLYLRPSLQPLDVTLEVDGVAVPDAHVRSTPVDKPNVLSGQTIDTLRPAGRYLLRYDAEVDNQVISDDGLPDNVGAVVGCVTQEG